MRQSIFCTGKDIVITKTGKDSLFGLQPGKENPTATSSEGPNRKRGKEDSHDKGVTLMEIPM